MLTALLSNKLYYSIQFTQIAIVLFCLYQINVI